MLVWRAGGLGHARVIAMHVSTEGMRYNPGVEGNAGHLEAEVRAVANVDPQTTRQRFADDRVHAAVLVHKPTGMTREGVGQDVTRLEEFDPLGQDVIGIDIISPCFRHWPQLAKM